MKPKPFYRVVLPTLAAANMVLGVGLLFGLADAQWQQLLQVVTGAFCCAVAGGLLASGWSKAYWSRAIERQVEYWRQMADIFCRWLEDAPVPLESLRSLDGSLNEITEQR